VTQEINQNLSESRRNFLKLLGAGAAAGTLGATSATSLSTLLKESYLNDRQDKQNLLTGYSTHGGGRTGEDGTDRDPQKVNKLTISSSDEAHYIVKTNGIIEKSTANGATENSNDATFVNKATGVVQEESDSYEIKGQITGFKTSGNVDIKYNGQEFTVEQLQQICRSNS